MSFPALLVLAACQGQSCAFCGSCASSNQCDIEFWCNPDHVCQPGCGADADCRYGDVCRDHQCVLQSCTDTLLHCAFNEVCGPDGVCVPAGGDSCRPCHSEADCLEDTSYCVEGYCRVPCDPHASECPAGFQCTIFLGADIFNGCDGDCESYAR